MSRGSLGVVQSDSSEAIHEPVTPASATTVRGPDHEAAAESRNDLASSS